MKPILSSVLCLAAWCAIADGPIVQTTPLTRNFLRQTSNGGAQAAIGIVNVTNTQSITNNTFYLPTIHGQTSDGGSYSGGLFTGGTNVNVVSTNPTVRWGTFTSSTNSNPTLVHATNFNTFDLFSQQSSELNGGFNLWRASTNTAAFYNLRTVSGDPLGPSHAVSFALDYGAGTALGKANGMPVGDFVACPYDNGSSLDIIRVGIEPWNAGQVGIGGAGGFSLAGPMPGYSYNGDSSIAAADMCISPANSTNHTKLGLFIQPNADGIDVSPLTSASDVYSLSRNNNNSSRWIDIGRQGDGSQDYRWGLKGDGSYDLWLYFANGLTPSSPTNPGVPVFGVTDPLGKPNLPLKTIFTNSDVEIDGKLTAINSFGLSNMPPPAIAINGGLLFDMPLLEGHGFSTWQTAAGGAQATMGLNLYWTNILCGYAVAMTNNDANIGLGSTNRIFWGFEPSLGSISNQFTLTTIWDQNNSSFSSLPFAYVVQAQNAFFVQSTPAPSRFYIHALKSDGTSFDHDANGFDFDGIPHLLTIVCNVTNLAVYIDDATNITNFAWTGSISNRITGGEVQISPPTGGGGIGECKVWNRALSTNEIKLIYDSYFGR